MHVRLAAQFAALWESSDSPPDVFAFFHQHSDASSSDKLNVLLFDQQQRWQTNQPLLVEDYLARLPQLASNPDLKLQLAVGEFKSRKNGEIIPDIDEFTSRFADLGQLLKSKLLELASGNHESRSSANFTAAHTNNTKATQNYPAGGFITTETYNPQETKDFPAGLTNTHTQVQQATVEDQRIGRYQLIRLLGQGGFGKVWLGFDEELQRQVAIKVPTPERFREPEDAEAYLEEARTVASLDHPNIVPVHDVGRTADGSIYVVSKFIEGCNLAERIQRDRPTCAVAANLLATVAQALHHAHLKRLIHRDVKPANILLEENTGTPYVADFGLAISEEDYLREGKLAGTPAYMSPEQARGEGHRLDGRSDIFSTGVMLYELLTGTRPFHGNTTNELLRQVITVDPALPRDLDNSIPAELERICLKALSKRASDRYSTAAELAEDLSHWQQGAQQPTQGLQIVPKGLRSFDAADANFYLDLLPGPRNRDGLPESIQFWKTRIEETDPDQTFSVGLIYGPSGCGKSSLVKAGLLPRLSKDMFAVYVEATPEETEIRILRGLRKRLPDLPNDLGLVGTFAALRHREGRKVVIVLDQFEQWLHAHKTEQDSELVNALRQCDGGHVQAVVMVRDDFAMAASRFMGSLDIPIVQGHNFATVDLFDIDHAQKVLTKFGQAFGKLPAQLSNLSDDAKQFLSSVANGLAQDGKVVSVRLALFAEMVKGKTWIPATLEQVGGTTGIGVNFLDETFSSRSANPQHRLHQQAARGVLKALLPEVGTDIKGHMRSHAELLDAAGYQGRPQDFHDLLRILDGELRLITPTDPAGFQSDSGSDENSNYYQLTHDYLVPSLREWLTRKQRETRRGRAELRLAERSALWNVNPENQQLPSLGEFLNIRLLTDRKHWTEPQRKVMRKAGRVQGIRSGIVAAVLLIASVTGLTIRNAVAEKQNATRRVNDAARADSLVNAILTAPPDMVPNAIERIEPLREYALPLLRAQKASSTDPRSRLHAAFALAAFGEIDEELLVTNITSINSSEFSNFVVALRPAQASAVSRLQKQASAVADLKSKVCLAATALYLGDVRVAQELLQLAPDPAARTAFIGDFKSYRGDRSVLAKLLHDTHDEAFRSGLCLALGSLPVGDLPVSEKQSLVAALHQLYLDPAAGGSHSAAGWSLRQWGETLPALVVSSPLPGRGWFVNQVGMVLLRIAPGSFTMGSEDETNAQPHEVTLTRPFYLSDREVSVAQYERFVQDPDYPQAEKPVGWSGYDKSISPTSDCPVQRVNWYDAALYCNWLSVQAGLKPYYFRGRYNAINLQRDDQSGGYRLPTEAQWEYACRAGTSTAYSHGDDVAELPQYALYAMVTFSTKRTQPCGSLRPNAWGLYDMHGNVNEWTWDWFGPYATGRVVDPEGDPAGLGRVVRGGSWTSKPQQCRSGYRYGADPDGQQSGGFRVALVPASE